MDRFSFTFLGRVRPRVCRRVLCVPVADERRVCRQSKARPRVYLTGGSRGCDLHRTVQARPTVDRPHRHVPKFDRIRCLYRSTGPLVSIGLCLPHITRFWSRPLPAVVIAHAPRARADLPLATGRARLDHQNPCGRPHPSPKLTTNTPPHPPTTNPPTKQASPPTMLLRRASSATAAAATAACCQARQLLPPRGGALTAAATASPLLRARARARALHTTLGKKKDYLPTQKESRKSLTKIVATIGPASEQFEPLQAVRTYMLLLCNGGVQG